MYIPLFNTTNYTLLSSLLKIDELITYAIDNNTTSIAISDSNMFGVMQFIKKCEKNNIKPIIGLEVITDDYSLVLYAKNYSGYQNLMKLSTIQNERKVDTNDLQKYNNNIISVIEFKNKGKLPELKKIYDELYLGYTNKKEEMEALLLTKNVVFLYYI